MDRRETAGCHQLRGRRRETFSHWDSMCFTCAVWRGRQKIVLLCYTRRFCSVDTRMHKLASVYLCVRIETSISNESRVHISVPNWIKRRPHLHQNDQSIA